MYLKMSGNVSSEVNNGLPLRLAVEPYIRAVLRNYFILPSIHEEKLCMVISDGGLVAVAVDRLYSCDELLRILMSPHSASNYSNSLPSMPSLQFIQSSLRWYHYDDTVALRQVIGDEDDQSHVENTWKECSSNGLLTSILSNHIVGGHQSFCREIIEGIRRYYTRQVLEPSIRGFLSILEKAFPRNDLYLFELLQNAVDDGALNISLTYKQGGLYLAHDGLPFTAMDCLGLASVGLSSKRSSDSGKRTIGFMGIGFKAVYKRFSKVTIYDDHWCLTFEQPESIPSFEPSHAWVMKPQWVSDRSLLWDDQPGSRTSACCHFQLERPRGGSSSLIDELLTLPITIPALLGRIAIEGSSRLKSTSTSIYTTDTGRVWRLQWDKTIHSVSVILASIPVHYKASDSSTGATSTTRGYSLSNERITDHQRCVSMGDHDRGSTIYWQFITLRFIPTTAAQEAFMVYTKRPWSNGCRNMREETSLFFRVDELGIPLTCSASTGVHDSFDSTGISELERGSVHAVLPTKLRLPTALHWQAAWLLSIDRQEVQSIVDNAWNMDVISEAPKLLIGLMIWASHTINTFTALDAVYALLPPMTVQKRYVDQSVEKMLSLQSPPDEKLFTSLLGVTLDLDEFIAILRSESIVPTAIHTGSSSPSPSANPLELCFMVPQVCMWLPPPFLNRLQPSFLLHWFGATPMCTHVLHPKSVYLPMWRLILCRPTEKLLADRRQSFDKEVERMVQTAAAGEETVVSRSNSSLQEMLVGDELSRTCIQLLAVFGELLEMGVTNTPPLVEMNGDSISGSSVRYAALQACRSGWEGSSRPKHDNRSSALSSDESNGALCRGWLPALVHWPIFLSNTCKLLTASEVTHWLSPEFDSMPSDVRDQLVEGVRIDDSETSNVVLLHRSVQDLFSYYPFNTSTSTILGDNDNDNESTEIKTMQYASRTLAAARGMVLKSFSKQVVSPDQAVASLYHHWSNRLITPTLSDGEYDSIVTACLRIFDWARTADRPRIVSHILVNRHERDTSIDTRVSSRRLLFQLCPINRSYIGNAFRCSNDNNDNNYSIETLLHQLTTIDNVDHMNNNLQHASFIISSIYLPNIDMNAREKKPFLDFLDKCGAQSEVSLVASTRGITSSEIQSLERRSLPKSRSTSTEIHLPCHLGIISRKEHVVVDATFSPEWIQLLQSSILTSNIAHAQSFAYNLSQLLSHIDTATHATPTTTPAVARLFFPAPGQSGASAVSIGPAEWLVVLGSTSWVPAAPPGASIDDPPSLVLRPSQVALPTTSASSRSSLVFDDIIMEEMPTIRAPASVIHALIAAPEVVKRALQWGTMSPTPPLHQLYTIACALSSAEHHEQRRDLEKMHYNDLVRIWRALSRAYRDDQLSGDELDWIQSIFASTMVSSSSSSLQGLNIVPAYGKLWAWTSCIRFDNSTTDVDIGIKGRVKYGEKNDCENGDCDDIMTGKYLSQMGFLLDIGPSNMTQTSSSSDGWVLAPFREQMLALINPLSSVSRDAATTFISWCCTVEPTPTTHPDQWPCIRHAFSSSLWLLIKPRRPPYSPSVSEAYLSSYGFNALHDIFPNLKLFCSYSPSVDYQLMLPMRWIPIWSTHHDSRQVSPVLIDDLQSDHVDASTAPFTGMKVSSQLKVEHNYQPLGVINHGYSTDPYDEQDHLTHSELKRLRVIDDMLLGVLGIHRCSDRSSFSLEIAVSSPPQYLDESYNARLEVVMILLQLHLQSYNNAGLLSNEAAALTPPKLQKHKSLSVLFKTPKMQQPHHHQVFALWGATDRANDDISCVNSDGCMRGIGLPLEHHRSRAILLSGESDDYSGVLEDLLFTYACTCLQLDSETERPLSVLRLVAYLEDELRFTKHLTRDFTAFMRYSSCDGGGDGGKTDGGKVLNPKYAFEASRNPLFAHLQVCLDSSIWNDATKITPEDHDSNAGDVQEPPPPNSCVSMIHDVMSTQLTASALHILPSGSSNSEGTPDLPACMTDDPELITGRLSANEGLIIPAAEVVERETHADVRTSSSSISIIESTDECLDPSIGSKRKQSELLVHHAEPQGSNISALSRYFYSPRGISNLPAWMTDDPELMAGRLSAMEGLIIPVTDSSRYSHVPLNNHISFCHGSNPFNASHYQHPTSSSSTETFTTDQRCIVPVNVGTYNSNAHQVMLSPVILIFLLNLMTLRPIYDADYEHLQSLLHTFRQRLVSFVSYQHSSTVDLVSLFITFINYDVTNKSILLDVLTMCGDPIYHPLQEAVFTPPEHYLR